MDPAITAIACSPLSGSGCVSECQVQPSISMLQHKNRLCAGLTAGPGMSQATCTVDSSVQIRGTQGCPGRGAHDHDAPEQGCYSILISFFSPAVHSSMDGSALTDLSAPCPALACGSGADSVLLLLSVVWGSCPPLAERRGPQCYSLFCTHVQWVLSPCPTSKKNEDRLTTKW